MSLRPIPARWFEILIAREDLVRAVDLLAHSGSVELETHSDTTQRVTMPDLQERLEEYNRLARRYEPYWPMLDLHPSEQPGSPTQRIDRAMAKLYAWQSFAAPIVERLESLISEQTELALLEELLQHLPEQELDFGFLVSAGPALAARLYILPPNARLERLPPAVLSLRVSTGLHIFLLAVGPHDNIESLTRDLSLQKGRAVELPAWLNGEINEVKSQLQQRQQSVATKIDEHRHLVLAANEKYVLQEVLGDITQLEWFITHISNLPVSENFAWISGWTSDVRDNKLQNLLERAGVRAVVHYPPAPNGVKPPMVLFNPWWSRPFELFAKLLGVPAKDELDPTLLLVIIVPLLFGYMFGDVGQGLVLLGAGVLLRRRWPVLKLLIACGVSSMIFGVVFGSVFASEHWLAPLWVNPISQPLVVLFVPLAAGFVILLLGLCIGGVEAYWRGEWRAWFGADAAIIVMYCAIAFSLLQPWSAAVAGAGAIWFVLGNTLTSEARDLKALARAIGKLLENLMQLSINTLSFIRVGAFALAHAGLSLALVVLANSANNPVVAGLIMVLGNVVIIILEGLVVSIQTTRLVLFEFFIRFLQATGRSFIPLSTLAQASQGTKRRTHP